MAQTTPPTVDAPPTAPSRSSPSTFSTLADAYHAWLGPFVTQVTALATNLYNNAVDAYNSAVAASGSVSAASGFAGNAASSASAASASATASSNSAITSANAAGAAAWVSGTTYAIGDVRWSPVNYYSYRRKTVGAGTTDPSADTTNWTLAGVPLPLLISVSGTTQTASSGAHYVLANVAATTLTLPSAPAAGDFVWVTVGNGLLTNVVAQGGSRIMSRSEDLTLNVNDGTAKLRYIDATIGWAIT